MRYFYFLAVFYWLLYLPPLLAHEATPDSQVDLVQLIKNVLINHPAVHVQQGLLNAADVGVSNARWQYFPTPSVSFQSAKSDGTDPSYGGDRSVTLLALTQPLWTGGRLEAGINKSQAYVDVAAASLADTQLQLAIRVVQTYGDWLSAYRKAAAFQVGLHHHIRLKEQVERRIQEGQAAASDLDFALSRLASLEADMAQAHSQEQVSVSRLSQLLGRPVLSTALASSPAQAWPTVLGADDLLGKAQAYSPALARARSNAQAQLATISEAKSATLPELSLRLERQHGNFNFGGSPQHSRAFIQFNSRLGAGLSNLGAVQEAVQRHAAAVSDIESQQRSLAEQVLTDLATLLTAQSRRKALQISADLSERVLASWDRQYLSGRKTWQDLMNSTREQVQVQVQLADLEGAQLVASWRIALTTGELQVLTVQK